MVKRKRSVVPKPPNHEPLPTSLIPPTLPAEMLEHIFQFLHFQDLKACRMVNKHWLQEATRHVRKKSDIISHSSDLEMTRLFRTIIEGEGNFPVNHFHFRLCNSSPYPIRNSSSPPIELMLNSIIPAISPFVKDLMFELRGEGNRLCLHSVPLDCSYPKLRSINMFLWLWDAESYEKHFALWLCFTKFVASIVENSENLREVGIELDGVEIDTPHFIPNLIEKIFRMPQRRHLLTSLDCSMIPSEHIYWPSLTGMALKLKNLELQAGKSIESNELIVTFLATQCGSLTRLKMYVDSSSSVLMNLFEFPRLEKLLQLEIKSDHDSDRIFIQFPRISYRTLFPKLKKFEFCRGAKWQDFLKSGHAPLPSLEELMLPPMIEPEPANPLPIHLAADMFPNIKKLSIPCVQVFAIAVFEKLPKLEDLTIVKTSGKFDALITGLSVDECEKFKRMSKAWTRKLKSARSKSLASLENLKTLRLRSDWDIFDHDYGIQFSKLSLMVFGEMKSLKCLDLWGGWYPILGPGLKDKRLLNELQKKVTII